MLSEPLPPRRRPKNALRYGTRSITAPLLPNTHPQQIRAAIRTVAAGQSLLSAEFSKLGESAGHTALSERELQVLQYIANGRSNVEIGQILQVGEDAIRSHVKSILKKLDGMGFVQKPLPSQPSAA
jgi:DNA-binding NarL/FixJ family response regulator